METYCCRKEPTARLKSRHHQPIGLTTSTSGPIAPINQLCAVGGPSMVKPLVSAPAAQFQNAQFAPVQPWPGSPAAPALPAFAQVMPLSVVILSKSMPEAHI